MARLHVTIEVAAYSVVAAALAEVGDHGRAESVRVTTHLDDGMLLIEVSDDGERQPGRGTLATASIPLA